MLDEENALLAATIVMIINDGGIGHGRGHPNDKGYRPLTPRTTLGVPGVIRGRQQIMAGTPYLAIALVTKQPSMTGEESIIGAVGLLIIEGISLRVKGLGRGEGKLGCTLRMFLCNWS
jgi:hypothetical protein